MARVLVIDDEPSIREFLTILLQQEGHSADTASDGEQGIQLIPEGRYDLVLTDLKMRNLSGVDVLRATKAHDPSIQVIVVTAFATTETAVEAMKLGAADYVTKPFKVDELRVQIEKALHVRALQKENLYLRKQLKDREGFELLVGKSSTMQRVYDLIARISRTRTTVLISGESGTGKELVARGIHQRSDQSRNHFIPVNCGAIPPSLMESTLFGHVRGAFTGAISDREGVFEAADDGTIFLDEVGELPADMQVKLLRVLQDRKVTRVGSTREIELQCRVIAATNKDLREEVASNRFREDLYYRLNVVQINVPPLRDRTEDIPLLVEHFVEKYRKDAPTPIHGVSKAAMQRLLNYSYGGNVRELENIIQRGIALTQTEMIDADALPPRLQTDSILRATTDVSLPEDGVDLDAMLNALEQNLLFQALEKSNGVRTGAAKLLGITFRSLRYRLDKHGIGGD